jgi:hypothetical protein
MRKHTDLLDRIDAAIDRIKTGRAAMRVPAESTDPDLVLADCKNALRAPAEMALLTDAARDVLTERRRQVDGEGFTIEHDDEHDAGDLASAASAYALNAACQLNPFMKAPLCETSLADELCADTGNRKVPTMWPLNWGAEWWKPKRPREDLVRAAALILGEIEHIDRDPGDESGNHNINGGDL